MRFSSAGKIAPLRPLLVTGACLLLAGCPSSSNPTKSQAPSTPSSTASSSPSSSGMPPSGMPPSGMPPGGVPPGGVPPGGVPPSGVPPSGSAPPASAGTGSPGQGEGSGEFPGGEFPADSGRGEGAAGETGDSAESEPSFEENTGGGAEPGFETAAGGDLPDMSDEPEFDPVLAGAEGAAEGPADQRDAAGERGGDPTNPARAGYPQGDGGSGGQGPLTPAEQVAVLEARLEQGTGDFDTMILEQQAQQREAARNSRAAPGDQGAEASGSPGRDPYGGDPASDTAAGGSSHGGGIGGVYGGGGEVPKNTAKYPPPADIPAGDDDDVVARQLREAAMREPDPAVREKLWDEYRKYKGIDK